MGKPFIMVFGLTINMHYSRVSHSVSGPLLAPAAVVASAALALAALAAPLCIAQYPGQVTKPANDVPELRAVAVLEWTGEAGKPKASRMVPITVFDGEKLQDGGVY